MAPIAAATCAPRAHGLGALLLFAAIGTSDAVQAVPYALRVADSINRARTFDEVNVDAHDSGTCLAPGQLKFAHVMKTGGLSVDAYLWCRCESEGCSVSHHEGGDGVGGDESCDKPSVCSSHAPPSRMYEQCGDFSNARVFTVLRDPVERVVSFYNYMRSARPEDNYPGYRPYKDNSLTDVLRSWGKIDLDFGQPRVNEMGGCVICAAQLYNAMVLRHFATDKSLAEQEKWNISAGVLVAPSRLHMEFQLAEAKKTLEHMDAIFLDMSTFKEAFERNDLLHPDGKPTTSTCDIPVVNPTSDKVDPTEEDLQLIRELNWADIELYNYAKTLPNVRK